MDFKSIPKICKKCKRCEGSDVKIQKYDYIRTRTNGSLIKSVEISFPFCQSCELRIQNLPKT